jgi:hypothetical protein
MRRALAVLVAELCACVADHGAAAPSRPPPVVRRCAADPPLDLLRQPVELDLLVLAAFRPPLTCAGTAARAVRASLDDKPWCEVSVPCTTTISAPPRSFACTGPAVVAGQHRLGVEISGEPSSLVVRTLSFPAIDRTSDGSFILGAHVRVWADDDTIDIDPPTAMRQMMF